MDGHHEPSVSSGKTLKEKVEIAENGHNITFMEKSDHQAVHSSLGGTQVPISASVLGVVAAGLELLAEIPDPSSMLEVQSTSTNDTHSWIREENSNISGIVICSGMGAREGGC